MAAASRPGEFELIRRHLAPLASARAGAFGLTDDAAVLTIPAGLDLVVTTDTIVEGVHFLAATPPGEIAAKLLRVNLSDLAAKGAEPDSYTLSLALPDAVDEDWIAAFAAGLRRDQDLFGIILLGGDTTATPGPLVLTLTAFGTVPAGAMLRRAGARAGDDVYVSGSIGDGALGLLAATGRLDALAADRRGALAARYRLPRPRLGLGRRLIGAASAAADVSDGLVADLGHIAEVSGLEATVELARVPLSDAARAAVAAAGRELLLAAIGGGDDYELVFTAPPSAAAAVGRAGAESGIAVTRVGVMSPGRPGRVRVIDPDGVEVVPPRAGYTHF